MHISCCFSSALLRRALAFVTNDNFSSLRWSTGGYSKSIWFMNDDDDDNDYLSLVTLPFLKGS